MYKQGDQLVHQRGQGKLSGSDYAENTIQSIFLEALETFNGILILTSNLQQNTLLLVAGRYILKC